MRRTREPGMQIRNVGSDFAGPRRELGLDDAHSELGRLLAHVEDRTEEDIGRACLQMERENPQLFATLDRDTSKAARAAGMTPVAYLTQLHSASYESQINEASAQEIKSFGVD